jgi:acyl-coenzyme A thioesterase PaaI-like protein
VPDPAPPPVPDPAPPAAPDPAPPAAPDPAPSLTQTVDPARRRLADATRVLVDAVTRVREADPDPVALDAATAAVQAATAALTAADTLRTGPRPAIPGAYHRYLPSSLLVGTAHPLAPVGTPVFADGVLTVRVRFGATYEGPPGFVHGGIVALAFDELFGMCNVCHGQGGLTGRLTVRYRAPTPLHQDLTMTAWLASREGRRSQVRGALHAGEVCTAEAEGLFVRPRPETRAAYFGGARPDA